MQKSLAKPYAEASSLAQQTRRDGLLSSVRSLYELRVYETAIKYDELALETSHQV